MRNKRHQQRMRNVPAHSWQKIERPLQGMISPSDRNSEPPGFAEAWSFAKPTLKNTAARVLRCLGAKNADDEAEGVCHDWYIKMKATGFRSYREKGEGRPFFPFACISVVRICIDSRRPTRLHPTSNLDREPVDGSPHPSRQLDRADLKDAVSKALSQLRPSIAEAIVLKHMCDMPSVQVAEILGITVAAVNGRTFVGRRILGVLLADFADWEA